MIIAQSAEISIAIILSECKGIGLKFAADVHFWIKSYFFIKKINIQRCAFLLFSWEVENGHFWVFCQINNHMRRKSLVVVKLVVRLLAVPFGEKIRDRRSTERAKVMRAEGALGKRREEKEGLNSLL